VVFQVTVGAPQPAWFPLSSPRGVLDGYLLRDEDGTCRYTSEKWSGREDFGDVLPEARHVIEPSDLWFRPLADLEFE
jgi:hypothetical protein